MELRYFKFTQDIVIEKINYKKGEILQVTANDEIINKESNWLFDVGSPLAKRLGKVVVKNNI